MLRYSAQFRNTVLKKLLPPQSRSALSLAQRFVTPDTPEQNGLIERFFGSLKEERVWQHRFASFDHARKEVIRRIRWYNSERSHQSLGYTRPLDFREKEVLPVG